MFQCSWVFMRSVHLQVLEGVCQSFMLGAVAATGEHADMDAFQSENASIRCLQGLTTCCHDAGGLARAARTMKLILYW